LVLLTKSDKLNTTEAAKALQIVKLQAGGGDVKLFSLKTASKKSASTCGRVHPAESQSGYQA
jgi:hypothetical protein